MARRPSRFRSLAAAVLAGALTAPAVAQSPLQSYALYLDGTPDGSVAAYFNGAHTMVSLENLAPRLHLHLTKRGATRLLHVGADAYAFSPGNTDVTLDGEQVMQTTGPPEERNRMLFVTVDDLEGLLSESIAAGSSRLSISTQAAAQNVHTAPLAHPRVSRYIAETDSASSAPRTTGQPMHAVDDAGNALVVRASLSEYNGFASRDLSFTTDGTRLRGSLDVSAFGGSTLGLAGGVALGTHDDYVQAGSQGNPLNGLVFNAPGGYGVSLHHAEHATTVEHDSLGRTVVLTRDDRDNGATLYGAIRANGTTTIIAGVRSSKDGFLKITRELWLSSSGAAASIGVATQGRIFGEAVLSQAAGNFPLTIGEAPDRLDAGFRIGNRLTLRTGIASGYAIKASPYLGLSFFSVSGTSGALQITGASRNASVSYTGTHGSIAGTLTSAPGGSSWGLSGTFTQQRRVFDLSAFRGSGSEDDLVRMHGAGSGGLIAGIERIVNNGRQRIGPVFGLSVPVGRTTAFEITEHPIAGGRALAFGLTQRIAFNPRVHVRMLRLQNAAAGDLYVDDRLVRRIDASVSLAGVAPGAHRIQLRATDGMRASLMQSVDDSTSAVDLALLPERQISGRVVQTDADPAGRKISLEHLQVRLEPGDLIVDTGADGSFIFPPSPVAPGARVSIVRDSVPDQLSLGDDAPADAVPLDLGVRTKIRVRHKKF